MYLALYKMLIALTTRGKVFSHPVETEAQKQSALLKVTWPFQRWSWGLMQSLQLQRVKLCPLLLLREGKK